MVFRSNKTLVIFEDVGLSKLATQEYFDLNPTMRLPLLINVSLKPDGRTPSGQSYLDER